MPYHPPSDDAMSTASTLVPPSSSAESRTTLTGRLIHYEHDSISGTVSGDGFGAGNVGANTLPPGYTDTSLVHIPIKTAQYLTTTPATENLGNDVKQSPPKKGGVLSRLSSKISGGVASHNDDADGLKIVAMSRGEYLKYWAKGDDGTFKEGVMEPPEGRAEWLANALERQEKEGLGKITRQRTKGTYGPAEAFASAGNLITGLAT
jgi:hypothetical protein